MSAEPPADACYLLLVTGDAWFNDQRVSSGVLEHVRSHVATVPDGGLLVYDDSVGGPAWCASKMAEWSGVMRLCYRASGKRYGMVGSAVRGTDNWWPPLHFPESHCIAIEMVWRAVRARAEGWSVRGLLYHGWSHPGGTVGLANAAREAWDHLLPPDLCLSSDVDTTGRVTERTP